MYKNVTGIISFLDCFMMTMTENDKVLIGNKPTIQQRRNQFLQDPMIGYKSVN